MSKRQTRKTETLNSPLRVPPSKFYSPKTPGWISGKNAVFETPASPSPTVIVNKKSRRQTLAITKTEVTKKNTAKSRRNTMAFKVPESVSFSPVTTRSRRSSMFSVSHRKGGVRLNIAVTPQTKSKNTTTTQKSSPGVKTRARRSTVYQKKNSPLVSKTAAQIKSSGEKKKETVEKSKEIDQSPVKIRINQRTKTPTKRKLQEPTPDIKTPVSPDRSTKKRGQKKTTSEANVSSVKSPKSRTTKTPASTTKSRKRKLEESSKEESLIKFETPVTKKTKEGLNTESPPKSAKSSAKKGRSTVKSPKLKTPKRAHTTSQEELFKTPATSPSKLKTPAQKRRTPRQTKTPAAASSKQKSPAQKLRTPRQTKTPAAASKQNSSAQKLKTPRQTKTPVSVSQRKRKQDTEIDLPSPISPPVKKTKTPKLKSSPVVILTKASLTNNNLISSTPVVIAAVNSDRVSPGKKKKPSPKKSPKVTNDGSKEEVVPANRKKSQSGKKKSKVKLQLDSVTDLIRPTKKEKRKATPGRNSEVEKTEIQRLDSKKFKVEKFADVSRTSASTELSQGNDLTLDATSHSSTGAKCIIL